MRRASSIVAVPAGISAPTDVLRCAAACCVMLGTASVASGQGGQVEIRLVPGTAPIEVYPPGSVGLATDDAILLDPASGITTAIIELQVRIIEDPNAVGFAAAPMFVSADGSAAGLAPAPLTFCEAFSLCDHPMSENASELSGMFPEWRTVIGPNNDDLGNGAPLPDGSSIRVNGIALAPGANPANTEWGSVFKFSYTAPTDLTDDIELSIRHDVAGYFYETPTGEVVFEQPVLTRVDSVVRLTVVPTPATLATACLAASFGAMRRRRPAFNA